MNVFRCSTVELSRTNCAVVNKDDFPDDVSTGASQHYVFTVRFHPDSHVVLWASAYHRKYG
jgi:hypothetical protein